MTATTVSNEETAGRLDIEPRADTDRHTPKVSVVKLKNPPNDLRSGRPGRLLLMAWDTLSLGASFAVGAFLRQPLGDRYGPAPVGVSLVHELPFVPLFMLVMACYGLYQRDRRRLRNTSFPDTGPLLHALAWGAIASLALSSVANRWVGTPKLSWVEVLFMSLPAAVLVPAVRDVGKAVLRKHGLVRTRLVVVGSGSVANSLARRLERCLDVQVVGFVDDNPHVVEGGPPCPHLGPIEDLPQVCARTSADRVLVAFSNTSSNWMMDVIRKLPSNVRVSVVPRLFELVTWQSKLEELHGITVMDIAPPQLGLLSRMTKRAIDIAVSGTLLLALSPLIALIALTVKVTSPGPVFFRQSRVGYKGRAFRILKFRSMEAGADVVKIDLANQSDVDGPIFKLRSDPRVTRPGRFLRATSLDEIPQLINVLFGQMSLVGPRPFVPDESAGIDGWAVRRFEMRPGITGLWQISGRSDLPFEELRRLDYAYVASWSLWWDLKIL
ncbi:MAG TPA: sugar transferase, partial [Acidimicrobiales bacterium]|nr:sugar transferase [Acidimicrobiales bacterium]